MQQANTVEGDMVRIGEQLRLARVTAGLKQLDVAHVARVNRFRLLKIEKGEVVPAVHEVTAIRKAIRDLSELEDRRRALVTGQA